MFGLYDQLSFAFSPVFPQSVPWRLGHWKSLLLVENGQDRLGYWNLSLGLSHSQESYKKSLVVT